MNVLVTGGTGFVGGILVNLLCARNDRATIVTRRPEEGRTARVGVSFAGWLPDLSRHEAVVNLAGASVSARRWNEAYKRELVESRVDRTRALVQALGKCDKRPRVLVNASAVGYYGDRGDELLDEDSAPASGRSDLNRNARHGAPHVQVWRRTAVQAFTSTTCSEDESDKDTSAVF